MPKNRELSNAIPTNVDDAPLYNPLICQDKQLLNVFVYLEQCNLFPTTGPVIVTNSLYANSRGLEECYKGIRSVMGFK